MKALKEFFPRLQLYVPGCPAPLMRTAVRDAAIDFCRRTTLIQRDADSITLAAGEREFDVVSPLSRHNVYLLARVWFGQRELRPMAPDHVGNPLAYTEPIDGKSSEVGEPVMFYMREPGVAVVWPTPQAAGTITARMVLVPQRTATSLPDELLEEWAPTIAAGAASMLKAVPMQPFTDPAGIPGVLATYQAGVNEARTRALRGGQLRAELQVDMRPF